jgi:hypothetical protein
LEERKMKAVFCGVWGLTVILGGVANAAMQMSAESDYGSYTITGSSGYFDVYLRFGSPDASITQYEGSNASITDLGVTAKQNHLFKVTGSDGDLFQIAGYGWATEVLDISMSRIGVYSDELDPAFHADAGGPYTIGPGESLTLDASQSYLAKNHGWNAGSNSPDSIDPINWKIDGKSAASAISFESLVNTLGLNYGTYVVGLDATAWVNFGELMPFDDSAVSTIQIIPEPATVVLVGLGGVFLRSRKH